jgi:hypothetical protein
MKIVRGHLDKLVRNNNFFCDVEFTSDNPGWLGT